MSGWEEKKKITHLAFIPPLFYIEHTYLKYHQFLMLNIATQFWILLTYVLEVPSIPDVEYSNVVLDIVRL